MNCKHLKRCALKDLMKDKTGQVSADSQILIGQSYNKLQEQQKVIFANLTLRKKMLYEQTVRVLDFTSQAGNIYLCVICSC